MDLPVVDVAPYLQIAGDTALAVAEEEEVRALCATVSASLRDTGALLVKDPRCSAADNDRFLDVVERYFARSDDSKRLQERPQLHYQVGVTPEGVEVPRSLVDKEMQDRIKSMPDEFEPATPKGPDPKWRYTWRVGPRPANTRFKELNSEPVIPDGLPEWKETMDSWGSKMISAIEVVAEMAAIGFGLSKDAFTSLMKEGPHLLAPTGSFLLRHGSEGTVFAGFHYDLNFLTIHGRSRFPGLNIWLRNGKKMEVKVPVGCLLIQSGKQAEWLTGDNLHSYFDYSAGMQGLFGRSVSPVQDIVVGKFESALLCLSSLHCYFGHPKKALEAFAEAVRVSQMGGAESMACCRPQYNSLPRRFYRTWSRTSQDPPPILQLTFHNEYDCKMETTVTAELFFKLRRLVYSIPADELIEMSDGDTLLLSEFSKSFLRAAALLVHGNYRRGYCIAPSFTSDNIDVFFATGSCVLKVAKWFYLNEAVNGRVMNRLTSYSALANYFIDILKRVEGPDVMDKLSPIVKDLFQKMTGVSDPLLVPFLEDLILNHPALMSTEGCVNVIQEAESLLKKQLLCSGIAADKQVASYIFSSQAYLWSNTFPISATDPCPEGAWIEVAMKHVALRHWYEFNWKQQMAGRSDLKAGRTRAYNIKKAQHDAQALFQLAESGKNFVSLWRNGIAHYADVELKEKLLKVLGSGKLAKAWPIKKQVVIAMFIINYPMFLPKHIESFGHANLLQKLNLQNCWPRQLRSYGYTPLQIAGLKSVILKSGLRHFH